MAKRFSGSYFKFLPNELIIPILQKLEFADLINFSDAYGCVEFLPERLTRTIDLRRRYFEELDLEWLSKEVLFDYVTTLNINGLYWIPYAYLSALLKKLSNLETLYAIDTKLDLSDEHEDISTYRETKKLKKLALTVKTEYYGLVLGCFPSVQTLYVKCADSVHIAGIERIFPSMSALWLEIDHIDTGRLFELPFLPHLRKFILQTRTQKFSDVRNLIAYHSSFRLQQKYTKCFMSMPATGRMIGSVLESRQADPAWSVLEESRIEDPLGPRDSQRLFAGETNLQNMEFEELNFCHGKLPHEKLGIDRVGEAITQILQSKNVRSLEKLCVSICQFSCQKCLKMVAQKGTEAGAAAAVAGRSRGRGEAEGSGTASSQMAQSGPDNSRCSHRAEHFLKNCPELEELEVWPCSNSISLSNAYPFSLIGNLRRLKKLTLFLPDYISGQFLPNILRSCRELEELRIESCGRNESLHKYLCEALPLAECLRDFRYKNTHTRSSIEPIIKSLNLLETKRLQRIALFSDMAIFGTGPMRYLLEKNPQLVFFFISVEVRDHAFTKSFQRVLDKIKKDHPSKVFLIKKHDLSWKHYRTVPDCHFRDMVECNEKVSTLDASHDFWQF